MKTNQMKNSLYHLSEFMSIKEMVPSIPNDYIGLNSSILEDIKIPRISFSPTIDGCVLGLFVTSNDTKPKDWKVYLSDIAHLFVNGKATKNIAV